jgi:HTH-type transcriptional regulator, transcriptional repressor of NAD biosynthesis genes
MQPPEALRPGALPGIALLGGESSGKTTLARALAERLATLWVPEYGRVLWEALRVTLDVRQLVHVARTQVAWEHEHAARAMAAGARWLVCDTTPLTTLQYCIHDHGHAPPELHELARRRYALTVLCDADFGFVQDGCRRDETFSRRQHDWTLARLAEHGVVPLVVRGSVAERVAQVLERLQQPPVRDDTHELLKPRHPTNEETR